MNICNTIRREFQKAQSRNWDRIYVFVDLHETILVPNWNKNELVHEYYPGAKEFLQKLSVRADIVLVMWTCSHHNEICQYLRNFEADGIHFDYINENPEVKTDYSGENNYGCYDRKPYYNILLDDKSGFFPEMIPEIGQAFAKYHL